MAAETQRVDALSAAAETESTPGAASSEAAEAANRLFARPWDFLRGCRAMADLPPAEGVEIAFAGRSNVGKSTLLNALTFQKHLAKSSATPGRTRELNFFQGQGVIRIVDMPGYGYAKAPKAEVAAWQALVFDYLRGRPNLTRVYLLIDARHGLKPIDTEVMNLLDETAVSYQVVLTKADKVKPGALAPTLDSVAGAIGRRPAAFPEVLATSTVSHEGLDRLRLAIARLDPGLEVPDTPADPAGATAD